MDLKPNFRTFFETLSFPLFFFEKIFNKDIYKSYLERNEAFNVTEFLKSDIIQNKNVSFDADKYMGKEIFINKKCFFTLLNYSNSDDLRFVKRDKEGWEESADFMGKDLRTIRIIENNHTTNTHLYEEHEVKFVYELLEIFDFKE